MNNSSYSCLSRGYIDWPVPLHIYELNTLHVSIQANALAAVELELIAQNQRTRSNRSRTGKKRWGSTAGGGESYDFDGSSDSDSGPAKHHGNTDEEVDSSSDESEGEALMSG